MSLAMFYMNRVFMFIVCFKLKLSGGKNLCLLAALLLYDLEKTV